MSDPIRRLIDLAESCVFVKQSLGPFLCGLLPLTPRGGSRTKRHPFFRSYGIILPSSFRRTHSSTLGFSPRLRVSVYGTVTRETHIEVFLGSGLETSLCPFGLPIASRSSVLPDLPGRTSYQLRPGHPTPGWSYVSASPHSVFIAFRWYWNINQFSIAYAVRPRLRVRLTLSGLTFLRKP